MTYDPLKELYRVRAQTVCKLTKIDAEIVRATNDKNAALNAAATDGRTIMPVSGPDVIGSDRYIPNPFYAVAEPTESPIRSDDDGHLLEAAEQIGGMKDLDSNCSLHGFTTEGLLTLLRTMAGRADPNRRRRSPMNQMHPRISVKDRGSVMNCEKVAAQMQVHGHGRIGAKPKRFILVPGWVRSGSDDQRHYVTSAELGRLYGVSLEECFVQTFRPGERLPDLPKLRPRNDGNYDLPEAGS